MRWLTFVALFALAACGGTGGDGPEDAVGAIDGSTSLAETTAPTQSGEAGVSQVTNTPDQQLTSTTPAKVADFALADFLTVDLTSVRTSDVCGVLGDALAAELPSASGFEAGIDETSSRNAGDQVPATTLAPTLLCGWHPVTFGTSDQEYDVSIQIANSSEIDTPADYIAAAVSSEYLEWDPDDYTTDAINGAGTVVRLDDRGGRVEAIFVGDAIMSTNAYAMGAAPALDVARQVTRSLDQAVVAIFAELVGS